MTIAEGTQRLPVQELRKLFLFEKLSDEQLQWLTQHGWVAEAPSGATFLAEGDPATEIARYAHNLNCGLVVMATHGHGPFRRFLLG